MKKLFLMLLPLAFAATAQQPVTPLNAVKPLDYNNPIDPLCMCADPTSVEYEGRLYVYGTNDQQQYDTRSGNENNNYGRIKSLVVLSTEDMVNWTHHGTIDMAEVCGNWLWASWAPSIVSRVEDDGLTHFYMYFSNSGGGVGVVTATSPLGPWTAPLNHNLISGSTPGLGACSCPFDPGVAIDDNGDAWLTFGGGDPVAGASKLFPGNARIVKLGSDMVSLASDIVPIPAPYHFEANELNIINGKYVYTYCTGWSDRNDWHQYSTTSSAPSTCSMCYMVSDNPLDPDSWQWGGEYLANPGSFGYPWGNNHTHLHKYAGSYYLLYHTQVMETLAGIGGGYRSIAVNKASVDEPTAHIYKVTASNGGAPVIRTQRLNALERQQAETFANAVGISLVQLGEQGNTCIMHCKKGSWVYVQSASFGSVPVKACTLKLKGSGKIYLYLDDLASEPWATFDFKSTKTADITYELPQAITGTHKIFFVFDMATASRFDEWQFATEVEGISDIDMSAQPTSVEYYSLDGRRVYNPGHGLYIRRSVFTDRVSTDKVVL